MEEPKTGVRGFATRKGVTLSVKVYFVDAMGSMAFGLFASLLIGTIFNTLSGKLGWPWLGEIAGYATGATGAAMAVAIGYSLKAPGLVLFSLCAVGMGANALGGPLGTLFSVIVAAELGKLVSKETKVDILLTPTVTIISGIAVAVAIGPGVSAIMTGFGAMIMQATVLRPFGMGILVAVLVGIALTLPISSAAICATLGLVGLAGGAATAGCCAQMVGFAVMSFPENRWGGILAQGLGTSMLQMGNIVKNPKVWIPPTLAGAVTGPIATCIFQMENGVAVASGMGTCGLVGPIGVYSSEWFARAGMTGWIAVIMVCIVLPAFLTPMIAYPLRKIGWIRPGDLKLEL